MAGGGPPNVHYCPEERPRVARYRVSPNVPYCQKKGDGRGWASYVALLTTGNPTVGMGLQTPTIDGWRAHGGGGAANVPYCQKKGDGRGGAAKVHY
jgi:hypothetical protein